MKNHIGFNGILHDSKTEAKASHPLAKLGFYASAKKFSQRFNDSDGTSFGAYDDFFNAKYSVHLEWKDCKLNGVKTKASSLKQLADKAAWRNAPNTAKENIDFGWNQAWRKQSIVQTALTPDRFIVCFSKAPPFEEALTYIKAGIVFCTLSSLPSYLAYLHLSQRGLAVGFNLNYTLTDEATGETHPAGFTYGSAVEAPPPKPKATRKAKAAQ